ncbi:MAG: sulfotransferase [Myxococcales bacterium]|nr:sulfotransferase [Myxococcales bacterium]MDH3486143.1 sulfotransferase [Myxococcales bacterium]
MSDLSNDIRIDDLRAPILTPMQKMVIDGFAGARVKFAENEVLGQAKERTGLSDFGPDDFRERLGVWLQAADEDTDLGPMGRVRLFGDMVRYAANRLRFQDLIKRHPEILDVEIERPIIIAGLPRSGTTHLLNLIAADTRLRSLPYWESLEPIPGADHKACSKEEDPRYLKAAGEYQMFGTIAPLLKNMHDMTPDHVHEEIELQALDFSTFLPEWLAVVPRWRDYYFAHDQRPHYAYMKNVLKGLQWLRGPKQWILKSPQHMEQLGPLIETFPDATVALTHRDPVSVIASAITMLTYGDRMRRTKVDPPAVAAYWSERVERLLRACVRDRDLLPKSQSIDVLFHEFMADDVAMVERIYGVAGLRMTPAARASLDRYMEENPRGKHGRIVYDLKGDFGVNPDELRARFRFYFERFPIRVEEG